MTAAQSKETNPENANSSEHNRLKWQIDFDQERQILLVKTRGLISWEDKKKLNEEMLAAGRKNNINAFLVDQKETSFGLSVLEIDRLPSMLTEIGFGPDNKLAILINHDSLKGNLFKFLQNVCSLRSMQIRVFDDTEKATALLKKKT
jgi:hypothetical protein